MSIERLNGLYSIEKSILPTEANFTLAIRETCPLMFERRSLEGNNYNRFFGKCFCVSMSQFARMTRENRSSLRSVLHIDSRTVGFDENRSLCGAAKDT